MLDTCRDRSVSAFSLAFVDYAIGYEEQQAIASRTEELVS
jgi:hypothetical protein